MKYLAEFKTMTASAKILITIMVLTVLSFFVQSALPPRISSGESDTVAGFLSKILSDETVVGRFVIKNIRKIGHFLEYGALGVQSALFINLYVENNDRKKR